MRRTDTCLADGRELFYHDTDDAPERTAKDGRDLEATVVASEIRRDPLSGEVAPEQAAEMLRSAG